MVGDNNRGMRDWLIFIRIAEAGSLTEAARQMNISTAAVSKSIRRFEDYLDAELFMRTRQGMMMTEAGKTTLVRAREIIASLGSLLEEIRNPQNDIKGTVRLTTSSSICGLLANQWAYDYLDEYPLAKVFLNEYERNDICRDSPKFDDLILRTGCIENEDLVHRSLSPIKLMLCASPSYLKNHAPVRHPRDLGHHRLFTMQHTGLTSSFLLSRGDDSYRIENFYEKGLYSNNLLAILNLAIQSKGISLAIPSWLAAGYTSRGELVPILTEWKAPELPVWLIWRQRTRQTKLFTHFRDYIEQCWNARPKI